MIITAKPVSRRVSQLVLSIFVAILLAGLIAPLINAAHYRERVRRALENSLGREVNFRNIHFTLFSGPGFALEGVTIQESRAFGIEPFAYVPTLEARIRVDKLLLGRVQFSSLRFVDHPSVNLVKRSDGLWNVVELTRRLAISQRATNRFPALEISDGRINFKFGTRKTTFYIAGSDFSIYPEASGKLYIQFSGSPARTDRPGSGFGHLHGTANWYLVPEEVTGNQLEANLVLEPSNLNEIATLLEGYDVGVHGTAAGDLRIDGPATGLRLAGELRLDDVHRWDLLPSSGEHWRIRYQGNVDLLAHELQVETVPLSANDVMPVAFQMRVNDFLVRPIWSALVRLNDAPAKDLVPLAKRMGIALPDGLSLEGTVDGAIGYSSQSGIQGGVLLKNLAASLPSGPPLRAANAIATISPECVHFDPIAIGTPFDGSLQIGGDYYPSTRHLAALLDVSRFPVDALNQTVGAWSGTPAALSAFAAGDMSGRLAYNRDESEPPLWSGQLEFVNASFVLPEFNVPLTRSQGRMSFGSNSFDIERFSSDVGDQEIDGDYHYNAALKHPERVHLHLSSADLVQTEAAFEPTLRAQGLLARLHVGGRAIPSWLASRNLEADVAVDNFTVNRVKLGSLRAHVIWEGPKFRFTSVRLNSPEASVSAWGTLDVVGYLPKYGFNAAVKNFTWRGGLLQAEGTIETSGTGSEALRNLHASGTFSGEDVSLSPEDEFAALSGLFELSLEPGWPDLRLSNVQASDDEAWNGQAVSRSDGKLIFELEHAGQQRRVVSTLAPETPVASSVLKGSENRAENFIRLR